MKSKTVRINRDYVNPAFLSRKWGVSQATIRRWIDKKWILAFPRFTRPKEVDGETVLVPSGYIIHRNEVRYLDSKGLPGEHTHIDHADRPYLKVGKAVLS